MLVMDRKSGRQHIGTATLVGRNLVLTNAHCTLDNGRPYERIYFYANKVDGTSYQAAHVNYIWRGTVSPDSEPHKDWAILRLDTNLGDDLGYLPLSQEKTSRAIVAGYSGDFRNQTTAAYAPCILHYKFGNVLHDGDTTPGASGSPLLVIHGGSSTVVALHRGGYLIPSGGDFIKKYDEHVANKALPVSGFYDDAKMILQDQDSQRLADYARAAREQIRNGDFLKARASLDKLVNASPENSWARLIRGYVCDLLGLQSAAANDYQTALRADPNCKNALFVQAKYSYDIGDYRGCITACLPLVREFSPEQKAYVLLSKAYEKRGQTSLYFSAWQIARTE